LSLENYVLALKDFVGVDALIDAIGIGIKSGLLNFVGNSMKSTYDIFEEKDLSKVTTIDGLHRISSKFWKIILFPTPTIRASCPSKQ